MASYIATVESEAERDPTLQILLDFIRNTDFDSMVANITLVTFKDSHNAGTIIRCPQKIRTDDLEQSLNDGETDHQLLVVENLTPRVLETIGRLWDIDPNFFRDYVDDSEWYRLNEVREHLSALQFVQNQSSHVHFRFVGPREVRVINIKNAENQFEDPVKQDKRKTTVPRIAGMFRPRDQLNPKNDEICKFKPVVLTRQKAVVWFGKGNSQSLKGIILLDLPFAPDPKYGELELEPPKFRSFLPTRWWHDNKVSINDHHDLDLDAGTSEEAGSYCTTFVRYLTQNQNFLNTRKPIQFVILQHLVHIIISEWTVVHVYVARELGNIDYRLEKGQNRDPKDLENFLNTLNMLRRRVELYEKLVREQLLTCSMKGPKSWRELVDEDNLPGALLNDFVRSLETHLNILASDFKSHREKIMGLGSYIVTLIHVRESQATITQSRSIVALSIVATVLLPFNTTASYMSIEGDLSVNGSKGWVFWVSSILVLCLVLICFLWFQYTDHFPTWRYRKRRAIDWKKLQVDV